MKLSFCRVIDVKLVWGERRGEKGLFVLKRAVTLKQDPVKTKSGVK